MMFVCVCYDFSNCRSPDFVSTTVRTNAWKQTCLLGAIIKLSITGLGLIHWQSSVCSFQFMVEVSSHCHHLHWCCVHSVLATNSHPHVRLLVRVWLAETGIFFPLIHSQLFPAIDHKMCIYYFQKLIPTNMMSFVHFWWVLEGRGCVHCGETKICWYLGHDEIKHAVSLMVALIHRFWQTFWLAWQFCMCYREGEGVFLISKVCLLAFSHDN